MKYVALVLLGLLAFPITLAVLAITLLGARQ